MTIAPARPPAESPDFKHKLLAVTWPLIAIAALMLSLCVASLSTLSSIRAFVNGEGMWSKAERQALAELHRFAQSGSPNDYLRYRVELAVTLGDRAARLELQSSRPDYTQARNGFLAGRNHPDDVSGMMLLFRLFRHSALLARPIDAWTRADELILQLDEIGRQMRSAVATAGTGRGRVEQLLADAENIHAEVAPLEDEFSASLGSTSRQVMKLLSLSLALCSIVLVGIGAAISRNMIRRSERIAAALREAEQEFAAQLLHQATHDALTGLANRRDFEQQLGWAILDQKRTGADYALLYLDLDQFKVVNDTCGHAAGDELICLVSWAVKQELRAGDVLARLGGDEFGILLANYPQQAALELAESVRHRISALRFIWEGKVFSTNASIGVLSLTESLSTVGDALSAADQACYMAKDNGRNRVQFYRPDDQEMRARHGEMRWVERLNRAIELDRFALFAQEIRPVGHPAGTVEPSRFEVLIRMVDADGTLIAPMAFIPAAERYGLMPRIDRWVIAKACSNLAVLRERHGAIPMCMINLSGASVTDPGMVDFVRSQLQKFGLPRQSIGFELTETAAISNLANASQLMHGLKEIGCPMALDDFGSGMASFAYLRGFPVDYLKIDGEFVKDMTTDLVDYEIVQAIHSVGRVMGVKTVAESVENAEILAALMLVGVDFAQGFHIHRPVPMMDIAYRVPRRDALPPPRPAMIAFK
jgi:diguanylate cyclase (GGDEF)-like protein